MKTAVVFLCIAVALCTGRQMSGLSGEGRQVHSMRIEQLSWRDCSHPTPSPISLQKFELSPDPIQLPGKLQVTLEATSTVEMAAPITLETQVWKRSGGSWDKVGCIHNIGSCHYPEVCQLLDKKFPPSQPCPSLFQQHNVTCHCPFPKGKLGVYNQAVNLPKIPWYVPKSMVNGEYRVMVNANVTTAYNLCVEFELNLHCQ